MKAIYAREYTFSLFNLAFTSHHHPISVTEHDDSFTGTYFFFTLPGRYSFQMTESSVTHVCTDCQNICSGRFGGNLRTTVLRRSVPLTFDCPWRFSLALDRDCFFAGSIVTLDMGGKSGRALVRAVLHYLEITRTGRLARFGNTKETWQLLPGPYNLSGVMDIRRVLGVLDLTTVPGQCPQTRPICSDSEFGSCMSELTFNLKQG